MVVHTTVVMLTHYRCHQRHHHCYKDIVFLISIIIFEVASIVIIIFILIVVAIIFPITIGYLVMIEIVIMIVIVILIIVMMTKRIKIFLLFTVNDAVEVALSWLLSSSLLL